MSAKSSEGEDRRERDGRGACPACGHLGRDHLAIDGRCLACAREESKLLRRDYEDVLERRPSCRK